MGLPSATHLQFAVLAELISGEAAGHELRAKLAKQRIKKSGPGFYQLMARLEDSGLVEGSYHQEIVEGQIIRERHYSMTAAGGRAWGSSRDFYTKAIEDFGGLEGLAGA